MTQKQLAAKVDVSPQVVSNWERGYTNLTNRDVVALCRALDTSADYLLGLADAPFPPAGTPTEPLDLADLLASEKTIQFAGRPLNREDREKTRRILEALFGDNGSRGK